MTVRFGNPNDEQSRRRGPAGLVLSGGGARAAYQVGVLKAIAQLRAQHAEETGRAALARINPFPIVVGTSAGAINATAFASGADHFQEAVKRIVDVWENFRAEQVYRTDSFGVIRTGARWLTALSVGWALRKWSRARPKSLFDNAPLADLLTRLIDPGRIHSLLDGRSLQALAVTVSSYTSGQHITFYQCARAVEPWTRSQRLAICEPISIGHLLASSAIPFVFPATALMLNGRLEYCGDGSMRQLAPISPAIHLGAERILVIGAGRMQEPTDTRPADAPSYPTIAQIAGHALSSIFLDSLAGDVERMLRVNKTLALMPPDLRLETQLKPIEVLVISPSQRLDEIASHHIGSLPAPVRAMLRGAGATEARGAALASYLLFESSYTRELIDLGHADTMARRSEVLDFLARSRPRRDGEAGDAAVYQDGHQDGAARSGASSGASTGVSTGVSTEASHASSQHAPHETTSR